MHLSTLVCPSLLPYRSFVYNAHPQMLEKMRITTTLSDTVRAGPVVGRWAYYCRLQDRSEHRCCAAEIAGIASLVQQLRCDENSNLVLSLSLHAHTSCD